MKLSVPAFLQTLGAWHAGQQQGKLMRQQEEQQGQEEAVLRALSLLPGLRAQREQQQARELQPFADAVNLPGLTPESRQQAYQQYQDARTRFSGQPDPYAGVEGQILGRSRFGKQLAPLLGPQMAAPSAPFASPSFVPQFEDPIKRQQDELRFRSDLDWQTRQKELGLQNQYAIERDRAKAEEERATEAEKARLKAELLTKGVDPKNYKTKAEFIRNATRDYLEAKGDPAYLQSYLIALRELWDDTQAEAATAPGTPADIGAFGAASGQSLPTLGGGPRVAPARPEAGVPERQAAGIPAGAFADGTTAQVKGGLIRAQTDLANAKTFATREQVDIEKQKIVDQIRRTGAYVADVKSKDADRKANLVLKNNVLALQREKDIGELNVARLKATSEIALNQARAWAARHPSQGKTANPRVKVLQQRIADVTKSINALEKVAIENTGGDVGNAARARADQLFGGLQDLLKELETVNAAEGGAVASGNDRRTVTINGRQVTGTREQFFNAGRRNGKSDAELRRIWDSGK